MAGEAGELVAPLLGRDERVLLAAEANRGVRAVWPALVLETDGEDLRFSFLTVSRLREAARTVTRAVEARG